VFFLSNFDWLQRYARKSARRPSMDEPRAVRFVSGERGRNGDECAATLDTERRAVIKTGPIFRCVLRP
jgi:hypothetical protein